MSFSFPVTDLTTIKSKVLNWLKQYSTFCFLDNHEYLLQHHSEECLVGAGIKRSIKANSGEALQRLQGFIDKEPSWLFGHIGYELNGETEGIMSSHPDNLGFPDLLFFEPEIVIRFGKHEMVIDAENPEAVFKEIEKQDEQTEATRKGSDIRAMFSRSDYISTIEKLKEHILRGDCYEINFCQE